MHTWQAQVTPSTEPTITRPDLDEEIRSKPTALRPFKVVVLDCSCHNYDDVEVALCQAIPGMTWAKAHGMDASVGSYSDKEFYLDAPAAFVDFVIEAMTPDLAEYGVAV